MARRIAAILYLVPGLGVAISTLGTLAYQDRHGELPMTPFGWRLMGSTLPGMGADHLTPTGTALAWVLICVSAIDVATSRWLWQDRRTVNGAETVIALRVTLIFRREEGRWRIAHRHADPITTARPITTTIQS